MHKASLGEIAHPRGYVLCKPDELAGQGWWKHSSLAPPDEMGGEGGVEGEEGRDGRGGKDGRVGEGRMGG